jgi:hypothetical protein
VVENCTGGVEDVAVMGEPSAPAGFSLGDGLLELVEVIISEAIESPAGLDQHPGHDLGRHAGPRPGRVAKSLCPSQEAHDIGAERTGQCLAEDGVQSAVQQVVVPGAQVAVQHQELEERLPVRAAPVALLEQQSSPCLRVGVTGQETPGGPPVILVHHASPPPGQPGEIVGVEVGRFRRQRERR